MDDGADQRISYWMVGILSVGGGGGVGFMLYNCSYLLVWLEAEDWIELRVSIDGSCEEHGV